MFRYNSIFTDLQNNNCGKIKIIDGSLELFFLFIIIKKNLLGSCVPFIFARTQLSELLQGFYKSADAANMKALIKIN